jgi:hypothetical protein
MFRSKTSSLPSPAPYSSHLPFSAPRISASSVPAVSSFPSVLGSSHLGVNRHRSAPQIPILVTPFLVYPEVRRATLAGSRQLAENTTALSLAFATLTNRVKHKSCVCHSCKKTPGWGSISSTHCSSRMPNPFSLFPHLVNIERTGTPATPILSSVYCIFSWIQGGRPHDSSLAVHVSHTPFGRRLLLCQVDIRPRT